MGDYSRIKGYSPKVLDPAALSIGAKESAIIVLIVKGDDGDELLLTRRTRQMRSYADDWCFPGGGKDIADNDLLATAWRELHEETGLHEANCHLLGQLDDFLSGSGHLVRPFVATIDTVVLQRELYTQDNEVSGTQLLPKNEWQGWMISSPPGTSSSRIPSYMYTVDEPGGESSYIWGLTASMLVHFCNVIFNQNHGVDKGVALARQK